MFAALEAVDISDLFRDMHIWATRVNDASGDVSFADLSDGERQLLVVRGSGAIGRGTGLRTELGRSAGHWYPAECVEHCRAGTLSPCAFGSRRTLD